LGGVSIDTPIQVLSLLGLAFRLLLAGLEVGYERFRGRPLRLTAFACGISFGLALLIGLGLGLSAGGLVKSPLPVAIVLSATSLGIVIPVPKDAGLVGTQFVPPDERVRSALPPTLKKPWTRKCQRGAESSGRVGALASELAASDRQEGRARWLRPASTSRTLYMRMRDSKRRSGIRADVFRRSSGQCAMSSHRSSEPPLTEWGRFQQTRFRPSGGTQ
jgi:Sodium/hydrogen exchanger family